MVTTFKNNFRGYLQFYYSVLSNKIYLYVLMNVAISLLDALGLAMFIPLLQIALNKGSFDSKSLGKLHIITDVLQSTGFQMTVVNVLLLLIFLFALKGVIKYFQVQFLAELRQTFFKTIRKDAVNRLNNISYEGFLKTDSGKIQNGLLSEVPRLFAAMTGFFNTIQCAAMLVVYYVLALSANFGFTVMALVLGLLTGFLYRKLFQKTQKASVAYSSKSSGFNGHLVQAINHFKYLKATDTFHKFETKLGAQIGNMEKLNLRMAKYQAISEGIKEPIAILIICAVVYIQYTFFPSVGAGAIMICLLLFYRALAQLNLLQTNWQSLLQNSGSMHSIAALSAELDSYKEKHSGTKNEPVESIELKDVSLRYNDITVFENIDLQIRKNTTVAFVGESGAGKTSLANIVIGLIRPSEGKLLINDKPLEEFDIKSYRNKIGYISQESVIFNDTIFNNVTFFDTPSKENYKRFYHVTALASLSFFIDSLPEKERTVLGDNGILISGGQRQRISIARELYKQCELLVLDEATSALDTETENIIKENIEKLHGNITIIIIAHRLSTVRNADSVCLLENKKLIQASSFEELMDKSGNFKNTVARQML